MRVSLKEGALRIRQADRWMDLNAGSGWLSITVHNGKDDSRVFVDIADDYTINSADIDHALAAVAPAD